MDNSINEKVLLDESAIERSVSTTYEDTIKSSMEIETSEESSISNDLKHVDNYNDEEYKKVLLTIKILYFLSGLTWSSFGRLAPLFYTLKGIKPTEMGYIDSTNLLLSIIINPFWAYISDRIKNKKRVYLICSIISSILIMTFSIDSLTIYGFKFIYTITIIKSLFSCGDILTPYALEVLGDNSREWGKLRVYLAFSWGFGTLAFTFLFSIFESFKVNFSIFFLLNVTNILMIYFALPDKNKTEQRLTNQKFELKKLIKSICNFNNFFFFYESFMLNIGFSFIENLLYYYMLKELKGSVILAGIMTLFGVVFEFPVYIYADYFLKNMDYFGRFGIAFLSFIIRMIGYGIISQANTFIILLFEPMHGISWVFFDITKSEIIKNISPEGMITSSTSFINLICLEIPRSFGFFIGGYIMENFSGRILYISTAVVMTFILIIHLIVYKLKIVKY